MSKHVKATKFGDHITADHIINVGDRREGDSGELVAMLFKCTLMFGFCYPSARKRTREAFCRSRR